MEKLLNQNQEQLKLLHDFMSTLSGEIYTTRIPFMYKSSIGMHVRHILEFYSCFLETRFMPKCINYDLRERNLKLETELNAAISKIESIINLLNSAEIKDTSIIVESGTDSKQSCYHLSSIKRELMYLVEHTTHHLATIKIAASFLMEEQIILETFGLAQSTVNHHINNNE